MMTSLYEDILDPEAYDSDFVRQQEELLRKIAEERNDPRKPPAPLSPRRHATREPPPPAQTAQQERITCRHPCSGDDDDDNDLDFFTFLQDEDMIKEQRRNLEQIQRERSEKEQSRTIQRSRQPSCSVEVLTDSLCDAVKLRHATLVSSRRDTIDSLSPHRRPQRGREQPYSLLGKPRSNGGIIPATADQDHVVEFGNTSLRVKGTGHTYKSIAEGTATIVQCSACGAILQVGSSAKLVYCTHCAHVTPFELAREVAASASSNNSLDFQIAQSVQQQEMDVACARKLARLTRQSHQT
jgi:hypothetical protein